MSRDASHLRMAPQHTVSTTSFDGIQAGLYIAMAETFLYGAYTVMFGFYISILHTRRVPQNRFLAAATILLFIFCTAHLGLLLATTAVLDRTAETSANGNPSYLVLQLNFAENVIYVTSNVIADSIFIFRCYAIWNFNGRIIVIPILSTFAVVALGYFDSSRSIIVSDRVFNCSIATSVFTTLQLMTLSGLSTFLASPTCNNPMMGSAGRIWWLALRAREVLGRKITTRYRTACIMILESGALYCVAGIVYIILAFRQPNNQPITSAFARKNGVILGQLVGIAPTIIGVRVGLGKSVESVDSFMPMEQQRVGVPRTTRPSVAPANAVEDRILYLRPDSDHHSFQAETLG
ncbi:hypothetical protein K438DRAFT_2027528 [Mycena galopus ATCC 62051]|nr:hypothetical protein K438DRAFT_2027528 [Mycena galopus ATCC 62051]